MISEISVPTSKGEVKGFLAYPDDRDKAPGIILLHEVWGLNDNIKNIAQRFVGEGYIVLAPDLISETGVNKRVDQGIMAEIKNPATRDEAQKKFRAALSPLQNPEFARDTVLRLEGVFQFLKNHEKSSGQTAVVGFCFGGTYAWSMAVHQPGLSAVVAFYGHALLDENELFNISCPVLAFYGQQDQQLVSQLPMLEKILDRLEKDFDYLVYPDCGHAFFNDTNPATFNFNAAQDSWAKTLAFLEDSF